MVKILTDMAAELEDDYSALDTFRIILIADSRSAYTFTVNTGTEVVTTSSNHDYLVNTRVRVSSTGTLPSPLAAGQDYLIATTPGSNTLTLKTTAGAAIDLTTTGSGTHTITDVAPDKRTSSIAEWVRKEVADYDGLAGRPNWVPVSATIDESTGVVTIQASTSVDNSAGSTGISFNFGLLIKGGSATRGNTTGEVSDYYDFGTTQLIAAGSTASIVIPIKRRNAA